MTRHHLRHHRLSLLLLLLLNCKAMKKKREGRKASREVPSSRPDIRRRSLLRPLTFAQEARTACVRMIRRRRLNGPQNASQPPWRMSPAIQTPTVLRRWWHDADSREGSIQTGVP